jgi:hypothetical protein
MAIEPPSRKAFPTYGTSLIYLFGSRPANGGREPSPDSGV